jgi:hypothetical protein
MSPTRSLFMSTIRSLAAGVALAACGRGSEAATTPADRAAAADTTPAAAGGTMLASAASLLGRWEKPEQTLPPVALELRADAADRVTGQVWLSGVTYEAPVALGDSSFVLGAGRPTLRGVRVPDGRLRVQFLKADGAVEHEELLVKIR